MNRFLIKNYHSQHADTVAQGTNSESFHIPCATAPQIVANRYERYRLMNFTLMISFVIKVLSILCTVVVISCGFSFREAIGSGPKDFAEIMNCDSNGYKYKIVLYKYCKNRLNVHTFEYQSWYEYGFIYANKISGKLTNQEFRLSFAEVDSPYSNSEYSKKARGVVTIEDNSIDVSLIHPSYNTIELGVDKQYSLNGRYNWIRINDRKEAKYFKRRN